MAGKAGRERVAVMDYYVYVLLSEKDGKLYTGISQAPEARLKAHNRGETRSTRSRRPFEMVYCERVGDRRKAREKEKFLKSGIGRDYLAKIIPR